MKNPFDQCLLTFYLNDTKKHDFAASPRLKKKSFSQVKQNLLRKGDFFGFWCFWEPTQTQPRLPHVVAHSMRQASEQIVPGTTLPPETHAPLPEKMNKISTATCPTHLDIATTARSS